MKIIQWIKRLWNWNTCECGGKFEDTYTGRKWFCGKCGKEDK